MVPRIVEKLGAGYSHAKKLNKDIIYCSVSKYGHQTNIQIFQRARPLQHILVPRLNEKQFETDVSLVVRQMHLRRIVFSLIT